MKNKPQRTCMGCFQKKDKNELIRIVKNKQDEVFIDKTGKAQGRGIYVCNDIGCFEKLVKNNKLEHILHVKISKDIYEKLRGVIIDK
ncbi:MAG: YlxR family protein [Clostridia bacterium]|nr:YlxR family protein [Clostridia bacterium]